MHGRRWLSLTEIKRKHVPRARLDTVPEVNDWSEPIDNFIQESKQVAVACLWIGMPQERKDFFDFWVFHFDTEMNSHTTTMRYDSLVVKG
jgi:hypothetical protein